MRKLNSLLPGFYSYKPLQNVAPYCTVTTSGWTGSKTGEVLTTVTTATASPITGKISLPPVNPLSSFTVHYTIGTVTHSVTADENGNLSDGNLTGTIAQDGTYSLSFTTLPTAGTDITADYSYGIPPANIENALDPSNPNPSDWGWKTLIASGRIGSIGITPPTPGHYLIGIDSGFLTLEALGYTVWCIPLYSWITGGTGDWGIATIQGGLTAQTYERRRTSLFVFYSYDPAVTDKLILQFSTNGGSSYKIRLYNIVVYKLS